MPCHTKRRWNVAPVESPEALADKLTLNSWCCCTGFQYGGVLFLNDAFSEDGAQEYAIVHADTLEQFESITFGWMERDAIAASVRSMAECRDILPRLNSVNVTKDQIHRTAAEHAGCRLCA